MLKNLILIISSVMLNAFAQIFIRKGMLIFGELHISIKEIFIFLLKMISNYYLLGGMVCYAFSLLIWFIVLSRINVSIAYPLGSIGYIITAILAYILIGEPLTIQKILGIIVICLGVWILTQTGELN